jgi:hypothetical protein
MQFSANRTRSRAGSALVGVSGAKPLTLHMPTGSALVGVSGAKPLT